LGPSSCGMQCLYVGSADAGQAKVADSPGYGKVDVAERKKGILVLAAADGELMQEGFVELECHIGWLYAHPSLPVLYGVGGGALHTFEIAKGGMLCRSGGAGADTLGNAAYLEISSDGRWALVACYSAGTVAVLPIASDGMVGAATDSKHGVKLNPALADRQEACHPHQIRLDPSGKWALCCDLGADRVYVYAFDAANGALAGAATSDRHLVCPQGSGPRHLDWHPSGAWVFVLCELSGQVMTCSWDATSGRMVTVHSCGVLDEGKVCSRAHHSGLAHILCSRDGRFVYVSSRTDNTLVTFAVDHSSSAALTKLQAVSTLGICPRNFSLDYRAKPPQLRCLNQDSQTLVSYEIDEMNGGLSTPPKVLSLEGVCGQVITTPI